MAALAWVGRLRARAIAASVVIGIAVPPLGALLKPFLTEAVFGLLCIAFLRMDADAFRSYVRRPGLVLAAAAWTTAGVPALVAVGCLAAGVEATHPGLYLGLMLQAVTSPMMATPAFAALLGLDATLVLAVLIASTALTPLSAPLIASAMGLDLSLSSLSLGLTLFGVLAGSACVGLVLRRIFGPAAIARRRDEIDGINILLLFVFIAAVMGEVGVRFLADPLLVLGLTAVAFAVVAGLVAVTWAVFARAGAKRALALGMMTSQRNMGLMIAGTGGVLPDLTWLYIAVSQFPIFVSLQLLQPVARRIDGQEGRTE